MNPKESIMHSIWLSWSSGKDSAFALKQLQESEDYKVERLVTTVTDEFDRVSMHSTRVSLLRKQAEMLGLPLEIVSIPFPCTNEIYEQRMKALIVKAQEAGISHIAFGDISLEDVRRYREDLFKGTGVEPLFPIWGVDSKQLSRLLVSEGYKAKITCVDPKQLSENFAGKDFSEDFLDELPATVDPCGEYGEFHSFVYDAPMFSAPIQVSVGEVVSRDGFVFADVS
jgi:uncharacterized protein (TIGR00290 family)